VFPAALRMLACCYIRFRSVQCEVGWAGRKSLRGGIHNYEGYAVRSRCRASGSKVRVHPSCVVAVVYVSDDQAADASTNRQAAKQYQ